MTPTFKQADKSDMPFLREMLYEAVYWRPLSNGNAPDFNEVMSSPELSKVLDDWGNRDHDLAIIALLDSKPAGAVWYRTWTDDNCIRGHISKDIPTLVLAVHRDYRKLGLGQKLIEELIREASPRGVGKISLMVAKDNHALALYEKCGFKEYEVVDDSLLMIYEG